MLTFEEDTHTYRWCGQVVPSVTQILQSAGFIDYTKIPEHIRDWALLRGKHVHTATLLHDEDDLVWDSLDPLVEPYVAAYVKFEKDMGFEPILMEATGYNKTFGYAGTLDRIGRVPDGRLWCVDMKSGSTPPWVGLQVVAYLELDEIKTEYGHAERYALQLNKDGTYRLSEPYMDANDLGVFLSALATHQWKETYL